MLSQLRDSSASNSEKAGHDVEVDRCGAPVADAGRPKKKHRKSSPASKP